RGGGNELLRIGLRRLVQPVEGYHRAQPQDNKRHQRQRAIFQKPHEAPQSISRLRKLAPETGADKSQCGPPGRSAVSQRLAPMKSRTNAVFGARRTSAGAPYCSSLPAFITATRSASAKAS